MVVTYLLDSVRDSNSYFFNERSPSVFPLLNLNYKNHSVISILGWFMGNDPITFWATIRRSTIWAKTTILKLYKCFIITKLTPSTVYNLRSSWFLTLFSYKVYIQIYIPLSCITVIKYLDCNDIFNSLPTVTSSASVFVCNCLTDVSFNLNSYWSRHCDTTVDHPACERHSWIEQPSSAWQADIITVIRMPQIRFSLDPKT